MEIYNLLDAFSDGFGGWRFVDVLGMPLMDLDDALAQDLFTLRYFAGIAETAKSKKGPHHDSG